MAFWTHYIIGCNQSDTIVPNIWLHIPPVVNRSPSLWLSPSTAKQKTCRFQMRTRQNLDVVNWINSSVFSARAWEISETTCQILNKISNLLPHSHSTQAPKCGHQNKKGCVKKQNPRSGMRKRQKAAFLKTLQHFENEKAKSRWVTVNEVKSSRSTKWAPISRKWKMQRIRNSLKSHHRKMLDNFPQTEETF